MMPMARLIIAVSLNCMMNIKKIISLYNSRVSDNLCLLKITNSEKSHRFICNSTCYIEMNYIIPFKKPSIEKERPFNVLRSKAFISRVVLPFIFSTILSILFLFYLRSVNRHRGENKLRSVN